MAIVQEQVTMKDLADQVRALSRKIDDVLKEPQRREAMHKLEEQFGRQHVRGELRESGAAEMRAADWCYVDDLEPGDHVYDVAGANEVEVTGYKLVRVPAGQCEWWVHTAGPTIRCNTMERVPRVPS